jgi:hypothetical protein
MLRVEHEDRNKITYAEHFTVVVVYAGAFDGWYRGGVRTHRAGSLKLKEPGEVHKDIVVHAPITLQGAGFAPELVAAAADAMGLSGTPHFKAPGFAPGERATELAFAMHDALVRDGATAIERETVIAETLSEIVCAGTPSAARAPPCAGRAPSCTTPSPTRSRWTSSPSTRRSTSSTWCAPSARRSGCLPTST